MFQYEVSIKEVIHSTDLMSVLECCEKRFESEAQRYSVGKGVTKVLLNITIIKGMMLILS